MMGNARVEESQLSELQARITKLPSVVECAVLRKTPASASPVLAYVVANGAFSSDQANASLLECSPGEPVPDAYAVVTALPRTDTGALDEDALRALPIVDESLALALERELCADPRVARAVLLVDEARRPAPALPLSRLLARNALTLSASAANQAAPNALRAEVAERASRPFALQHGDELVSSADAPRTLTESLERAARTAPGSAIIYLGDDGSTREQSFAGLFSEAAAYTVGLRKAGVGAGQLVLLQLPEPAELLPAFWACLLIGAVPANVAVPASYTAETSELARFRGVIELLEQPFVLATTLLSACLSENAESLGLRPERILSLAAMHAVPGEFARHHASEHDVAFMTFTSGSTGMPKGIPLTHDNLLSRARGTDLSCGNDQRDIVFNWLPFDHIGSISDWHLRCVELRCRMVYGKKELVLGDALNWLRIMDRYRITHSWAPNFAYGLVNAALASSEERWDLSCVKTLLSAGEAVSSSTVQEFSRRLATHGLPRTALRPAFGMAELGSGVNYYRPTSECPVQICHLDRGSLDGSLLVVPADDPRAIGFTSLGPIIPGASMRIVDGHDSVLPELTIGRLQITGGPVHKGYYNNPSANQATFTADGWFDTGDRGFIADAELYLTGRDKETLVINGANFYNGELEAAVEQVSGVVGSFTAACAVRPPGATQEELAIFFVPARARGTELALLLRKIQTSVTQKTGAKAHYLLPVTRADIPKTAIGKLQRKQLARLFEEGAFAGALEQSCSLLEGADTIPDWFLRPAFQPQVRPTTLADPKRCYLLIKDDYGLWEALLAVLEESGAEVQQSSAADASLAVRVMAHSLTDVVDVRGFAPHLREERGTAHEFSLADETASALLGLIKPIRTLAELRGGTPAVARYWVVASHAQLVHTQDRVEPARAAAPAMLRSLSQELAGVHCSHVDVPFAQGAAKLAEIAQNLAHEMHAEVGEPEAAYRDGQRFCAGFERVSWPAPPAVSLLRAGGSYVVTGGLGGVGVALSRYLLQQLQATVLLVGRSSPSLAAEATLEGLEQLGSVRFTVADVSQPHALQRAVEEFERSCGREVDGFFHLASSYHEGPGVEESFESLRRMFQAKLNGAVAVGNVLAGRPRAFAVHFSSIAGAFGGSGLAAYGSANRSLDAVAAEQRRRGLQSYAIDWSVWDGLGIGARTVPAQVLRAKGLLSIASERGLTSLVALLARPAGTFIVGVDVEHRALLRLTAGAAKSALALRGVVELASGGGPDASQPAFPPDSAVDRLGTPLALDLWQVAAAPLLADGTPDRAAVAQLLRGGLARTHTPPTTAFEAELVEIWKQILGVAQVGVDDNFFELGGTSLLAVRLFAEIERRLGPNLPLATLFQAATVQSLALVLAEILAHSSGQVRRGSHTRIKTSQAQSATDGAPSPLVLIQAGSSLPFFCVHGAGGNVLNLRDVAQRLGPSQTFYGLQARGVDGSATQSTVEEMAELYVSEILTLKPEGPYLLGGYSAGGVVAFEMARRLRALGHDVPVLALLDTFCAGVKPMRTPLVQHMRGLRADGVAYLAQRARVKCTLYRDSISQWLKVRVHRLRQQPLPFELREQQILNALIGAAEGYRPTPYSGPAVLYRAAQVDPWFRHVGDKRGWDDLLPGLDVVEVPGNHVNFVLDPHVSVMTTHLARTLRAVDRSDEARTAAVSKLPTAAAS